MKPHIQELLDAVHTYDKDTRWTAEDIFRSKLMDLNIDELFNWDEEPEETPSEKKQRQLEEAGDTKYHESVENYLLQPED